MKRNKILNKTVRLDDLSTEDLYDDASGTWQDRSERIRIKRLRQLKHQDI